jgi:hypothetical protein
MAENRLQRELDNRTKAERPKQWAPASLLPEPDKQPGYAYRWIRVSSMNAADPRNLSKALQEGWEAVRAEEQPNLALLIDPASRYKDNIEVGGLLLCKTPIEFKEQRDAHYQRQTNAQMQSVDNALMRQSDARMPLFNERKSSTTFGKGE